MALFLNVSASEAFWLSLESRHLIRFIYEREEECHPILISFPELRQLALLFAQVVEPRVLIRCGIRWGGAVGAIPGRAGRIIQ